ncbi:two pore domain potassium channel family protein [Pseudooceanicola sediminis]|uniref:Two pore domain potassium channel family protein n=2 Tax=Pseudooceanicola sediminis TaxID=2211117 RepID=A0A399IVW1_9RHOB|nr:two pore domain potassium channel family protein [Puniceibacterium sp. HSS470]MCB1467882.1 two pore domain potassium channel family protein [Rhizobiaceae bacterium]RII37293.1 two pore domain potassium channel family protein [Pseudooceanicola sediminis]
MSGLIHVRAMSLVMAATKRASFSRSGNLLIALYCLAIAHILEAGLYAVGFSLGEGIGIGGFAQANVETFMDVFYFSVVNYSSLGLGDIYPTGHLRFLAGVEALNGFLLISCSASTIFLVVTRDRD